MMVVYFEVSKDACCPYCLDRFTKESKPTGKCNRCQIPHHEECWGINGGCTTYGCQDGQLVDVGTPATVAQIEAEGQTPVAYVPAIRANNPINPQSYNWAPWILTGIGAIAILIFVLPNLVSSPTVFQVSVVERTTSPFAVASPVPSIAAATSFQETPTSNSVVTLTPILTLRESNNFYCVVSPAPQYTAIFLRDRPWWLSKNDSSQTALRGARLNIKGKIETTDDLWYQVEVNPFGKRYVSAKVCVAHADLVDIPTILETEVLLPLTPTPKPKLSKPTLTR